MCIEVKSHTVGEVVDCTAISSDKLLIIKSPTCFMHFCDHNISDSYKSRLTDTKNKLL